MVAFSAFWSGLVLLYPLVLEEVDGIHFMNKNPSFSVSIVDPFHVAAVQSYHQVKKGLLLWKLCV